MGEALPDFASGKGNSMGHTGETFRLDVDALPELETEVAISGSTRQQEVGGGICLGIAAGIAVYVGTSGGS